MYVFMCMYVGYDLHSGTVCVRVYDIVCDARLVKYILYMSRLSHIARLSLITNLQYLLVSHLLILLYYIFLQ